jgi:hypothetical protein
MRIATAVLALSCAPLLPACGSRAGCVKDTDCKGERVCVDGECVSQSAPKTATPTKEQRLVPATATPVPPPQATPAPVPDQLSADGLPVEIPAPGSPPPSVAEWNAVPREIVVAGSTRLNCETKMLREWLKVNCRKNFKGAPIEARHVKQMGQQAFQYVGNGLASIVVQVVRGKEYQAQFIWDRGGGHTGAELTVSWPQGNPRPAISLIEN